MIGSILKAKDLRLGDVVIQYPETPDAWQASVVTKIERSDDGKMFIVTFFRPYVTTRPSINNSVTPLIGIEQYRAPLHDGHAYRLISRERDAKPAVYGYRFNVTQRHVASDCTVHANKVDLEKPLVKRYLTEAKGRDDVAKWNRQNPCWQYTVDSVEPITDPTEAIDLL